MSIVKKYVYIPEQIQQIYNVQHNLFNYFTFKKTIDFNNICKTYLLYTIILIKYILKSIHTHTYYVFDNNINMT